MAFEISSIEQADTTTIDILHPSTGVEIGATMEVYGDDSDHMQSITRKASAKYAAFAQKHNFRKTMPPEQAEEIELDKDIQSVKAFTGFTDKKAVIPFSAGAVKSLFAQFPSFREQVKQARIDRSLFIKG